VNVPAPGTRRDLSALFAPPAVAIVGASDDPVKWGHWLARGALRGEARRRVYLVNRRGGEVMGRTAHRSLAELPEPPSLAVIAVPPAALEPTVGEAIAAGARAIVVITAGAADGDAGGARDQALAELARAAGVVLLGPNCLGVFDAGSELDLVSDALPRGTIGLISQSGNLALEIGTMAAEVGLGFSRFVSVGNQADLQAAELIHDLAEHEATELIAIYVEDFLDGRAFAAAAGAATRAGKPVVLMAIEHSEATARAVASHTGALASDDAAIDAACRAAGIVRVRAPQELVDVADGLLRARALRGRRVAVLTDGGGHASIAAALLQRNGLRLPVLSGELQAALRAGLPAIAAVSNPIDLAGGGEQDIRSFDRSTRMVLESGEVDAMLISGYFGGYSEYSAAMGSAEVTVIEALAAAAKVTGRPVVVQTMHPRSAASALLRRLGIPVFRSIERAADVCGRLAERGERGPEGVPALPPAAPPVSGAGYAEARALLAAGGLPFVGARTVADAGEAVAAARELGYPVVLKALGTLHKSDAGGVALGLRDEPALAAALADMELRLAPPAFTVEQLAPVADGIELLIGARWDARFGPIALVALGGLFTEILRDTAVALAPLDEQRALELLHSLRAAPLLLGARARPPSDMGAAAAALAALSRVAAEHPEIAAIEVNPLLVLQHGALGLDARLELAAGDRATRAGSPAAEANP
jgi:acetate---CoA ligase (ADP-forming)